MKRLIAVVLAVSSLTAVADDEARKILPVPPSRMADFNAKTGGLVDVPADAKKFVIVDARQDDTYALTNYVRYAERYMSLSFETRVVSLTGKDDPVAYALNAKKAGAGAVMLLCERDGMPTLNVFPEDGVSVLNVKPLRDSDSNTYRRRVSKEFWRALGFAMGAYGNPMQLGSVMQPVFSVQDLDDVKGVALSPPQMSSVLASRVKLKIYGDRPVPYSRACREGWAPAPTNDVQRSFYKERCDPARRLGKDLMINGR